MKLFRIAAVIGCTLTVTLLHADYPFGIMPDGASIGPAERLARAFIGKYCKTHTEDGMEMMSTYWTNEAHGYAVLLAAYCYDNDETLKKLWNFCVYMGGQTSHGLVPWAYQGTTIEGNASALDGNVDIAIGLDYAAQRWPDSDVDWDAAARYYTKKMYQYERNFNKGDYVSRSVEGLYYNNYSPFPYFQRYYYRTNIEDYKKKLVDDCYFLSAWSYNNWRLPCWTVNGLGEPRSENDPDRTANTRWQTGPARFGWRVGHHYLATGDQRALNWARRIIEVYDSGPYGRDPEASYMTTRLDVGGIYKTYNADAGKPKNDERNSATTILGAGVCAMAVGNKTLANKVWNWVKDRGLDVNNMIDGGSQAIGALIMSGEFDVVSTERGKYPPVIDVASPANGSIIEPQDGDFTVNFDVNVIEQFAKIGELVYYEKNDSNELVEITKKSAAPWSHTWTTTKGAHSITLIAKDVDGRASDPVVINLLVGNKWEVRPYSGSLPRIGLEAVTIEAEHFDFGGQNVAYYDNTPAVNRGSEFPWLGLFRINEGVDIKGTKDPKGELYVGYTNPGPEWTEYSVEAVGGGTYQIDLMAATDFDDVLLEWAVDGEVVAQNTVSKTGGWESFATVTFEVPVPQGRHVLRLSNTTGGANLNKFTITPKSVHTTAAGAVPRGRVPQVYAAGKRIVCAGFNNSGQAALINARGQVIASSEFSQTDASFSVAGLHKGIYYVRVSRNSGGSAVHRIMVH